MAVSPDAAKTVVGLLGNVIALALFLSPMPTFYGIWKKRAVDKFSAVPYLATFLNCMLWIVYGLPMVHPHSVLILTINGSGVAIELFYILVFLAFSDGGRNRLRVLAILLLELTFVGIVAFLVLAFAHTTERRTMIVGIVCIVFNTMMYASPLSVMVTSSDHLHRPFSRINHDKP